MHILFKWWFFQDFGETIPKPQNSNGDDGLCDLDYASSTIVGDLPLGNMVKGSLFSLYCN